jgi:hypothetical protein
MLVNHNYQLNISNVTRPGTKAVITLYPRNGEQPATFTKMFSPEEIEQIKNTQKVTLDVPVEYTLMLARRRVAEINVKFVDSDNCVYSAGELSIPLCTPASIQGFVSFSGKDLASKPTYTLSYQETDLHTYDHIRVMLTYQSGTPETVFYSTSINVKSPGLAEFTSDTVANLTELSSGNFQLFTAPSGDECPSIIVNTGKLNCSSKGGQDFECVKAA